MGVDSIWTWDHFFPALQRSDGPHDEGWSLLAAIAVNVTQPMQGDAADRVARAIFGD